MNRIFVSKMLTSQALTLLNLHRATHIRLYTLCPLQPRLGQTRPFLAFQTRLIG